MVGVLSERIYPLERELFATVFKLCNPRKKSRMKPILVFDTETTGFANFKNDHKSQTARLVQFAGILFDESQQRIATYQSLVQPDGFEIPKEASDVHGITTEYAQQFGVPISYTLDWLFNILIQFEPLVVAHNIQFDKLIVDSEFYRAGYVVNSAFTDLDTFCTMLEATKFCAIPGRYGKPKWPKCTEAYSILCGKELVGAHGALQDAEATAEIYFELKRRMNDNQTN